MRNYRVLLLIMLTALAGAAFAQGGAQGDSAVVSKDAVINKDSVGTNKDAAVVSKDSVDTEPTAKNKGLDLDKLLAEDDEDDLLTEEKPAVAPTVSDSLSADSSAQMATPADSASTPEKLGEADSAKIAAEKRGLPGSRGRGAPGGVGADDADQGPVVIQDGRTVNFAQNLKEYRSPKVAMLLSLLVPGLGQAYCKNYIKAAAFGAAEAGVIGVAAYFNSVGKKKKREAHDFADSHFDAGQMRGYHNRLTEEFERRIGEGLADSTRAADQMYAYFDIDDILGADGGKQKSARFYESIRDIYYTPGWIDNEPGIDAILEGLTDSSKVIPGSEGRHYALFNAGFPELFFWIRQVAEDGADNPAGSPILGYSRYQEEYNRMVNDANSYHDAVNYTLYALLLNHIASAVDAMFTARAYNARLLGQEASVWDRLSAERQYVFTGSKVSPGLALKVRF